MNILIVDDSALMRGIIRQVIEEHAGPGAPARAASGEVAPAARSSAGSSAPAGAGGAGAGPGSFELFEAANGHDALSMLASRPIDLVLLDWNMPVLDGLAFVKHVRNQGMTLPIIMVTAVSDEDKIYQAAKAGVTSYLEKPILGSDLWERLKDYLR